MQIDLSSARFSHLNWRFRLHNYIYSDKPVSREELVSHSSCELGQWLYAKGMNDYGAFPEMQKLERVHKELHQVIAEVVSLKDEGKDNEAKKAYRRMDKLSTEVMALLDKLESYMDKVK